MSNRSSHPLLVLFAGVSGGLLAGAVVGLLETIYLSASSANLDSMSALWFAIITYGVIGFGIAFIWTIIRLARKLHANVSWLDSLSVMIPLLVFSIALFRVRRDLLKETVTWNEPVGWLLLVGALLGISIGFLLLRALFKRLANAAPRKVLLSSWGLVIVLVIVGWFLKSLAPMGPGSVEWPAANWKGEGDTPPNVLLIVVDTLRDDFLTKGSPHYVETPNIDSLAAQGIRFSDCQAQASKTRPSVASILTSLYPSTHGCERKIHGLPPDILHFPQLLGEVGYATVGLVNNINLTPFFGFDRGFDVYRYLEPSLYFGANDAASNLVIYGTARKMIEKITAGTYQVRHYYWEAQAVTELATNWLEASPPEPFFLWVYYMDPHDPYFDHPFNGEATARVVTPNPPPEKLPVMLDQYKAEIRYMDEQVGQMLKALDKSGNADNTIIVFTSDHGEEFLEHGGWWHGTTLYHEVLDVPLIVRLPDRQMAGTVRTDPVMGVDVAPTVVDFLGIPYPEAWEGIPLFSTVADPTRTRFSEVDHEGNQVKAINQGDWIWIQANPGNPRNLPTTALFNLVNDPGETLNLAEQNPQMAEEMQGTLLELQEQALSRKGSIPQLTIDRATEERLRALGYTK